MKEIKYIFFALILFIFMDGVYATDIGNNGQSLDIGGAGGSCGTGPLFNGGTGLRISVLDNNGNRVAKTIDLYKDELTYGNVPGSSRVKRIGTCSKIERIVKGKSSCVTPTLVKATGSIEYPDFIKQTGSSGTFIQSLFNWLEGDNYKNLRTLVKSYNGYKCLDAIGSSGCSVEDMNKTYIVVEPMAAFGGHFATAYEHDIKGECINQKWARLAAFSTLDGTYFGKSLSNKVSGKNFYAAAHDSSSTNGIMIYRLSDIVELPKNGTVTIEKQNKSGIKISSSGVKFNLYSTGNCSGTYEQISFTGSTTFELAPGTYSIKETQAPTGYILNNACTSFTVTANNTTKVYVENGQNCESKFAALTNKKDPTERIRLYKLYHRKNLLNFNDTTNPCGNPSKNDCNKTIKLGCLSSKYTNSSPFSASNMSCYDETITVGTLTGYCKVTFNLMNNLTGSFDYTNTYSFGKRLAGRMLLKRNENNKKFAQGKIIKTCYVYGNVDEELTGEINKLYSDYVGELYLNGQKFDTSTSGGWKSTKFSAYTTFTKTIITDYNLKPVFAMNGSGKLVNSTCSNCVPLGYGFASNLNSSTGTKYLPFTLELKDTLKSSISTEDNACSYEIVRNEIVDTTPEPYNPETLNLEFRVIDTKNPFPGKFGNGRRAGRNWCVASIEDNKLYRKCAKRTLQGIASSGINNIENLFGGISFGRLFDELKKLQQEIKNSIMVDLSEEERNLLDINSDSKITIEDSMLFLQYWINWKTPTGTALNKINQLKTYYLNNMALLEDTELDCESNNSIITEYIIDSTDSYGYNKSTNTYNNKPMYHIVLDSKTINSIRKYNKENPYDNYNMKCETNGKNCTSNFLDNSEIWNSENLIQR